MLFFLRHGQKVDWDVPHAVVKHGFHLQCLSKEKAVRVSLFSGRSAC